MNNQNQTYPLVKSPALRRATEYIAAVLLIVTIILGLTASEAITLVSLGVFLMVAAFAAKGFSPTTEIPALEQRRMVTSRITI